MNQSWFPSVPSNISDDEMSCKSHTFGRLFFLGVSLGKYHGVSFISKLVTKGPRKSKSWNHHLWGVSGIFLHQKHTEEWRNILSPLKKGGEKLFKLERQFWSFFALHRGNISRIFCLPLQNTPGFQTQNHSISRGFLSDTLKTFGAKKSTWAFFVLPTKFLKMPSFFWRVTFAANSPPTTYSSSISLWCRHRFVARGVFRRRHGSGGEMCM